MRMTYRTARALGWDAANRQMTREGRISWNEADALLAATVFRERFPSVKSCRNRGQGTWLREVRESPSTFA